MGNVKSICVRASTRLLFTYFIAFNLVLATPAEAGSVSVFCNHALAKISELPYFQPERMHEILFRVDLALNNKGKSPMAIELSQLNSLHKLTFSPAIEKAKSRARILNEHADEILTPDGLTSKLMEKWIPSKNGIRVMKNLDGQYIVFDGNGRLEAIRHAFPYHPKLLVEVEYWLVESRGVLSLMERVRRLNHVEK